MRRNVKQQENNIVFRVVFRKPTDVSEEHVAFILWMEEYAEKDTLVKTGAKQSPTEDGGYKFLRNVG
jgi:hypothetical protein